MKNNEDQLFDQPSKILKELSNKIDQPIIDKENIEQFIKSLETGLFGNIINWPFNVQDFLIWIIGLISVDKKVGSKNAKFIGETKLHKVCYFLKNYKFNNLSDFIYEPKYFGPFSSNIEKQLETLQKDKVIYIYRKKKERPESFDIPNEFKLSKRGYRRYLDINQKLNNQFDKKKLSLSINLLEYLYVQNYSLLSWVWHRRRYNH